MFGDESHRVLDALIRLNGNNFCKWYETVIGALVRQIRGFVRSSLVLLPLNRLMDRRDLRVSATLFD